MWTSTFSQFKTFLSTGDVTDRALGAGINNSSWTAEEIQEGMTKTYAVDIIGVSRFLYFDDGVKFLKDQTRSYFRYWKRKSLSVVVLRSAIITNLFTVKYPPPASSSSCSWTSAWLTAVAPMTASRTSALPTSALAMPSTPLCCPCKFPARAL